MSHTYGRKNAPGHGKASEDEITDFFKKSTIQRIQEDREMRVAVDELRAENARYRLAEQRELDDEYRNYVIPV